MSVYSKRFNIHYNGCSYYTNDPAEALSLYRKDDGRSSRPAYIVEGYADYSSGPNDTTCVTRRTIGKVLPSTLEFLIARAEVEKMIERLRQ